MRSADQLCPRQRSRQSLRLNRSPEPCATRDRQRSPGGAGQTRTGRATSSVVHRRIGSVRDGSCLPSEVKCTARFHPGPTPVIALPPDQRHCIAPESGHRLRLSPSARSGGLVDPPGPGLVVSRKRLRLRRSQLPQQQISRQPLHHGVMRRGPAAVSPTGAIRDGPEPCAIGDAARPDRTAFHAEPGPGVGVDRPRGPAHPEQASNLEAGGYTNPPGRGRDGVHHPGPRPVAHAADELDRAHRVRQFRHRGRKNAAPGARRPAPAPSVSTMRRLRSNRKSRLSVRSVGWRSARGMAASPWA